MTTLTEPLATNVSKAKVVLLRRFPFFGHLALSAPVRESTLVSTAGVSGTTIYINPNLFNDASIQDQVFLLAHELLHLALQHQPRKGWREKVKWNLACDIVVNDIIESQGMHVMQYAVTKHTMFGDTQSSLTDVGINMEELNAETIYSMISGFENMNGQLEESFTAQDLVDEMEGESGEKINWDFQIKAAAKHARLSYGDMPGWIERKIGITKPKLDWISILSYFVGSVNNQERSYRRLSKRHLWRDAIIPRNSNYDAFLAIVIDASGSITPKTLNMFINEINNTSLTINVPFRVIVHDTAITLDTIMQPGSCNIRSIKGGGGTDFIPVINSLKENPPDGVVWLTDGYGRYPEEPQFPILWILTKRHYEPPYGWSVVLDDVRI